MKNLDINEVDNLDRSFVIDVRDTEKYNNGHIEEVRNVAMSVLVEKPEKYLSKEETYYVMCTTGGKSFRTQTRLVEQGYDVVNLVGGYSSYTGMYNSQK